ncbi:MAG: CARDB domain-containing protein [Verrucomicrobiales bacterium]
MFAQRGPDFHDGGAYYQSLTETEIAEGETFFFSHRIVNSGNEIPEPSEVRYYLTEDKQIDPAHDLLLGVERVGEFPLAPDYHRITRQFTMPPGAGFASAVFIGWDIVNADDTDQTNNRGLPRRADHGLAAAGSRPTDAARFHSFSRTTVEPGGCFRIGGTVRNLGPQVSAGYQLQFHLSGNAVFGDSDDIDSAEKSFSRSPRSARLAPAIRAFEADLCLSAFHAVGTSAIRSSPMAIRIAANNTKFFTQMITVAPATDVDLFDAGPAHDSITYEGYVVNRGSPINVAMGVFNGGDDPSLNYAVRFYASPDNVIGNGDDIFLGGRAMPPLAPNFSPPYQPQTVSTSLPTTSLSAGQTYYIGWKIEGGNDGNTANNTAVHSARLSVVELPDLAVDSDWTITGDPDLLTPGCLVISGTVRNLGVVTVAEPYLSMKLKRPDLDLASFLFTTVQDPPAFHFDLPGGPLIPGEIRHISKSLTLEPNLLGELPVKPGINHSATATVGYDGVNDANESNNQFELPNKVKFSNGDPFPDLRAKLLFGSYPYARVAGNPGDQVEIQFDVINGGAASGPFVVKTFFDNQLVATENVSGLGSGSSGVNNTRLAQSFAIPNSAALGEHQIRVIVDTAGQVDEYSECNNEYTAPIMVGGDAELSEGDIGFRAQPDACLQGVPTDYSFSIRNMGIVDAGPFHVRLVLSPNPEITLIHDLPLAEASFGGLLAGEETEVAFHVAIPNTVTPGEYYVGWIIDPYSTVTEIDEANNIGRFYAPVRVGVDVNLRPGNLPFSLAAAEAARGETVELSGSFKNSGAVNASGYRLSAVLSSDQSITTSDRTLLTAWISTSPPSGYLSGWDLPFPEDIKDGRYWVGFIIDADNDIEESDETDNVSPPLELIVRPAPEEFRLRILGIAKDGDDMELYWTSRTGYSYQLEKARALNKWSPMGEQMRGDPLFSGGVFPGGASDLGDAGQFRVREIPPANP